MKKEYLSPEVEIIEVGLQGALLAVSEQPTNPNPGGPGDFAREDDNGNTRPGSGNVWDEGW